MLQNPHQQHQVHDRASARRAGAVEAIVCVLTIRDGIVHPTIDYHTPDPNCDLDYVPNQARKAKVDVALSNSFGFGGHNGTLIFKRCEA